MQPDPQMPPGADQADPILKHFSYTDIVDDTDHKISKIVAETAMAVLVYCPRNPERSAGLRKLMEALDCFRRAVK